MCMQQNVPQKEEKERKLQLLLSHSLIDSLEIPCNFAPSIVNVTQTSI